jgi:hypothetical protein
MPNHLSREGLIPLFSRFPCITWQLPPLDRLARFRRSVDTTSPDPPSSMATSICMPRVTTRNAHPRRRRAASPCEISARDRASRSSAYSLRIVGLSSRFFAGCVAGKSGFPGAVLCLSLIFINSDWGRAPLVAVSREPIGQHVSVGVMPTAIDFDDWCHLRGTPGGQKRFSAINRMTFLVWRGSDSEAAETGRRLSPSEASAFAHLWG